MRAKSRLSKPCSRSSFSSRSRSSICAQEPGIDPGGLEDLLQRPAGAKGVGDVEYSVRSGPAQLVRELLRGLIGQGQCELLVEAVVAELEAAQSLVDRFLKRAPDRHRFADRFHLCRKPRIRPREFLEGEARDLGDHVIDRRLERGRSRAAGDIVLELVQRVADRQFGGDLGNREAGGLGRQRRGARHPRIHFDHQHAAVVRIHRELHVRTAGIDADLAQHRDGGIPQTLILAVGERLRRRHGDRIACVHTHRVQIFDRTNDDAIVVSVPDHLHLILFPPEHGFLEQHLIGGRGIESARHDRFELFAVVGDPSAAAAQGEGRPDDSRKADLRLHRERLFHAVRNSRTRGLEADVRHGTPEQLAVFRHVDGAPRGADHLDIEFLEHALAHQIERRVESGLAAHGRQQGAGPLLLDDACDGAPVDRLDIDRIGALRVGHDGGRIGVHQNDPISLFFQCLTGLSSRIIELTGLTDDDRSCADDQDAVEVGSLRHGGQTILPRSFA